MRNAGHTLVKLLAPVSGPSLLLSGFTHGEYGPMMQQVLDARGRTALVLHGCEGEAVPHPSRQTPLFWVCPPAGFLPVAELAHDPAATAVLPPLGTDLQASCAWTRSAVDGDLALPTALNRFVALICDAVHAINLQVAEVDDKSLP